MTDTEQLARDLFVAYMRAIPTGSLVVAQSFKDAEAWIAERDRRRAEKMPPQPGSADVELPLKDGTA